eukprot:9498555-Pyramimonas_sp.AAC.1
MTASRLMSMREFAPRNGGTLLQIAALWYTIESVMRGSPLRPRKKAPTSQKAMKGAGDLVLARAVGPAEAAPSGSDSDCVGAACASAADCARDADAMIDACDR